MTEETKNQEQEQNVDEMELAELANQALRQKEEENAKLRKELARMKLFSEAPEEEDETMSSEECLKVIGDKNACSYDLFKSIVNLYDNCKEEGKPSMFGCDEETSDKIRDFLNECVEECDGQKDKLHAVYQAKIGADNPQIASKQRRR